ncbi:cuticle protein 7 [Drosophila bipectinata]|uniref:cuticle protein 7 n=1 Tax=Drosophila bipectinata TaxID=42026 RepID=UPI001C89390A|nr:cuticle protein 7 [Drosophila bipectinata]
MMGKLSYLVCLFLVGATWAIELQPEPDYGPVAYEFQWAVNDPHTGDIKSQKETRKDDKVEGVYELIDSDGYRRIVQYKADDHNGFEAIVQREPTDIKIPLPEPPKKLLAAKILTPIVPVAPLVHYAAPKAIIKQELSPGNYVSVSGPTATYKY